MSYNPTRAPHKKIATTTKKLAFKKIHVSQVIIPAGIPSPMSTSIPR